MPIEAIKLDLKRKEDLINKLLTYMKNKVEEAGRKIDQVSFGFSTD